MPENVYRSQQVQGVGLRSKHMYACMREYMCVYLREGVCMRMCLHTCEFVHAHTQLAARVEVRLWLSPWLVKA